ncbi:hypothetical protein P154DRAFT_574495 [Amniculicola lignicola CBS 123094]|uniref:Uncharacterized protein n=1 Tax=Amniculicola lignicola CBS 123094 TaxID=1392246 RepID=A0A6A5WN59_9PLEO|nr:hypothetical protein P154DRAFT_574495 [Amniculicola lignicola CBS 123094]
MWHTWGDKKFGNWFATEFDFANLALTVSEPEESTNTMSSGETSYREYTPWSSSWGWCSVLAHKPKPEAGSSTVPDLRAYDFFPYFTKTLKDGKLPPYSCHLEDRAVGHLIQLMVGGELPKSTAHQLWPNVFDTNGNVYRVRRPMGRAATALDAAGNEKVLAVVSNNVQIDLVGAGPKLAYSEGLANKGQKWWKSVDGKKLQLILTDIDPVAANPTDTGAVLDILTDGKLTQNRKGQIFDSQEVAKRLVYPNGQAEFLNRIEVVLKKKADPNVRKRRKDSQVGDIPSKLSAAGKSGDGRGGYNEADIAQYELMKRLTQAETATATQLRNSAAFGQGIASMVNQALLEVEAGEASKRGKRMLKDVRFAVARYATDLVATQSETAKPTLQRSAYDADKTIEETLGRKAIAIDLNVALPERLPNLVDPQPLLFRNEPSDYPVSTGFRGTSYFNKTITEHLAVDGSDEDLADVLGDTQDRTESSQTDSDNGLVQGKRARLAEGAYSDMA